MVDNRTNGKISDKIVQKKNIEEIMQKIFKINCKISGFWKFILCRFRTFSSMLLNRVNRGRLYRKVQKSLKLLRKLIFARMTFRY